MLNLTRHVLFDRFPCHSARPYLERLNEFVLLRPVTLTF